VVVTHHRKRAGATKNGHGSGRDVAVSPEWVMKKSERRARQQTFELPLGDILFINLWFGLLAYAIFSALID